MKRHPPTQEYTVKGIPIVVTTTHLQHISVFQGNILSGAGITITRGSLVGRALANAGVTMTDTDVHGSCAPLVKPTCASKWIDCKEQCWITLGAAPKGHCFEVCWFAYKKCLAGDL